ncbi:2Fe-2S ferredoxin [Mycobacterium kyorinense]|uniref:2Fe-2S ferredoxin n=1 Tax=Mycobacterium kyorinense TaxID=487514 RepID=A0A1A2ZDI1_9MYCO|nr:DUF5914 domain-containing protein [Mycobacterium kyorinense]OBI48275.1 2Fe-2S ferredoxin [Mycobacterium kyorinense]
MNIRDQVRQRWPKSWPLQIVPPTPWARQKPTYRDAKPVIINAALDRSQRRPTGNWYAFAASREIRTDRPFGVVVAGVNIVAWRDQRHRLHVGPRTCPHLGADLATGVVHDGTLMCRWHGLAFDGEGCDYSWAPLRGYDDGVLAWVRLDDIGTEPPSEKPSISHRPTGETVHTVAKVVGICEPVDIIANRLDPWHGAWFHPYSFTSLEVLSTPTEQDDRFLVAVTFRMARFGVPVIAEFTCTDARTVVMRIMEGEGVGSVVETHATPIGPGADGRPRTAVLEAVVAHSSRPGFPLASRLSRVIAPLMRYAATRLWRDDLAYAERRYQLRAGR